MWNLLEELNPMSFFFSNYAGQLRVILLRKKWTKTKD